MTPPDLSARDRQEIDELYRRLPSATHYDLLGVDRGAAAEIIVQAHRGRTLRFSPEALAAPLTNAYMQRLEAVQEALDAALAILSDPVRRYLYDQELDQRPRATAPSSSSLGGASSRGTPLPGALPPPQNAGSFKRTPAPGSLQSPPGTLKRTPAPGSLQSQPTFRAAVGGPQPPRAPTPPGAFRAPEPPTPIIPHAPTPTEPLGVLHPEARPTPTSLAAPQSPPPNPPSTPKQTGTQRIATRSEEGPPRMSPSQPPAAPDRVAVLEAQVSTLQSEVATLLTEVERLAVSIQLTIARQLEPEGVKPEQLITAGHALVSSRVAIATLLARREEAAGRWEAASALWQRAARARPSDVLLLVNAANALRKAGTDMPGAKALARQAVELDPDNPDAQSALAVLEARRRPSP